jgi:hypothetical protein
MDSVLQPFNVLRVSIAIWCKTKRRLGFRSALIVLLSALLAMPLTNTIRALRSIVQAVPLATLSTAVSA